MVAHVNHETKSNWAESFRIPEEKEACNYNYLDTNKDTQTKLPSRVAI